MLNTSRAKRSVNEILRYGERRVNDARRTSPSALLDVRLHMHTEALYTCMTTRTRDAPSAGARRGAGAGPPATVYPG
jgi:hypothetical protein